MQALTEATAKLLSPLPWVSDNDRLTLDLTGDGSKFTVAAYRNAGTGYWGPSASATELLGRMGEKKKIDNFDPFVGSMAQCFEIGATDFSTVLLTKVWPIQNLEMTDDVRQVMAYHLLTLQQQEKAAEVVAKYKADKVVPEHNLEVHPENPLSPYQQVGLVNSYNSEGYLLLMEQGTGKTPIVIANVCNLAKKIHATENRPARIIIVCPNNVRLNWLSEFQKFATCKGKVTVMRGDAMARVNHFVRGLTAEPDDCFTALVMSYGTLVSSWDVLNQVARYDLAAADEIHYAKNPSTKRYNYLMKLRDKSARRMGLTGTPISNTPLDLYSLFEFAGKGFSGFNSWKNFRKFYGVFEETVEGFEKLIGCQNKPFLQERLVRCSFSITKKEALPELPEKVYDVCEVEMSGDQAAKYNQLRDTLALEMETRLDSDEPNVLVINSILTQLLKLAQITSGFLRIPDDKDEEGNVLAKGYTVPFNPNPKVEALLELLKDKKPEEKTIVWACWTDDIHAIYDACEAAGHSPVRFYGGTSEAKREEAIFRFNHDPTCKVFIGNALAGGAGLNLLGYPPGEGEDHVTNANHTIYYSQNWSYPARSQSEDRNHRRGTRQAVRYTDLCVPGSIDEEIRARVTQKKDTALEIGDVRDILTNLLAGGVR